MALSQQEIESMDSVSGLSQSDIYEMDKISGLSENETTLKGGVEKSIDLTPSGMVKQATAGIVSPIRAFQRGETIPEAYKRSREIQDESVLNNFSPLVDLGAYIAMPEIKALQGFKGADLLNKGVTGAYQGGLISGLESLKEKGLSDEAFPDTLIGGSVGGTLGTGLPLAFKGLAKGLESPAFKNATAKTIEALTSVPEKFSKLAINKELSGNSILNGSFDVETAYRPIEKALRKAKSYLPTREDLAEQFYQLGQKAHSGMQQKQTQLTKNIRNVLNKLDSKNLDISDLKETLFKTIDDFSNGGNINPAFERAGREIKDVKRLLGIKSQDEILNELEGIKINQDMPDDIYSKVLNELVENSKSYDPKILRDKETYLTQVKRFKSGKMSPKELIPVVREPSKVWQDCGLPNKTLGLPQEVYKKAGKIENSFNKNHNISDDILNSLPELIQDPQYILKSATRKDRFVGILNALDNEQRPILVAIQPAKGRLQVNLIPSLYGRQNFPAFIQKQAQDGNLLYTKSNTATASRAKIAQVGGGTLNNSITDLGTNFNPYDKAIDDLKKATSGLDENTQALYTVQLLEDMQKIENITNPKIKAIDLHNVKELLYDIANYENQSGIKNSTTKALARDINSKLRSFSEDYAKVNDDFALLKDVEYALGGSQGLNSNTIAGKLANYGSVGNIASGLDRRLKNIDTLLDPQYKFYKQVQDIVKDKNSIDEISSLIGNSSYERNPRLLSNFTDEAREDALKELQNRTGVIFSNELDNIRAREALERWTAGQGGGSGSSQGYQNLLRSSLTGGLTGLGGYSMGGVGALSGAAVGLSASSPKIMGKGTIKNIGKLYNLANKEIPKWLLPLLMESGAKTFINK